MEATTPMFTLKRTGSAAADEDEAAVAPEEAAELPAEPPETSGVVAEEETVTPNALELEITGRVAVVLAAVVIDLLLLRLARVVEVAEDK